MLRKPEDLTEQRFGMLTAKELVRVDKNQRRAWLCKCDCGNSKAISAHSLKKGLTTSCGCKRKKDLTGQRFGHLEIVGLVNEDKTKETKVRYWLCKCDCGGTRVVQTDKLNIGEVKHCGCLDNVRDITGKRFGKLTVLSLVSKKNRTSSWLCRCDCGQEKIIPRSYLITSSNPSCGCLNMAENLTGKKFNRMTVIKLDHMRGAQRFWECACDCGVVKVVSGSKLKSGLTQSCGCYNRERSSECGLKHGMSGTRTYQIWQNMKTRCYDKKSRGYCNYGGRGITVCERWLSSFDYFIDDMGMPPSEAHEIDRIDVNGNYEPDNCRWFTSLYQARNKRTNVFITFNNKTLCLSEWAEELGLSTATIYGRSKRGWSDYDIITVPYGYTREKYYASLQT